MGSDGAWAPFAELNNGAFFWLGLGASTTRLEAKPPASEADGGGKGGSARGQEKQRQWGCPGVQGELPVGTSQR